MPTPRADPLNPSSPDPNHLTKLSSNTSTSTNSSSRDPTLVPSEYAASVASEGGEDTDAASVQSKKNWFGKKKRSKSNAGSMGKETVSSGGTDGGRERDESDDVLRPLERTVREDEWRLGDDIRQHLDI